MEENRYLDEEKYQQSVKKLKKAGKIVLIIGICMLVIGLILLILGFVGFGKAGFDMASQPDMDPDAAAQGILGGFGLFAAGGILDTTGLFVTGIGAILLITAHRREIAAFAAEQVMPVAKETIEEITPAVSNAVEEIGKGIRNGLNDSEKQD